MHVCQQLAASPGLAARTAHGMVDATAGDLTQQLSEFLDRHLVFPLLEFVYNRQLYDADDIQKAKIALLGNTNMVDYAMDIHESLYGKGSVPQAMNDRRAEVCTAARDAPLCMQRKVRM